MEEVTLDLGELFKVIKRKKHIVLGITLLFLIAGSLISLEGNKNLQIKEQEYVYKSMSSILVGDLPDAYSENVKDVTALNQHMVKTYGAIAASRTVAKKVINEVGLNVRVDEFLKNVKIKANPDAQMIIIIYGDKNEKDIKRITDTYINQFTTEAQKMYPNSKLKILDEASSPEKITKDEFNKIDSPKNNEVQQMTTQDNKGKSKKFVLIVSLVIGIMVGLGVVFFMEFMNNSIKKKEEAESIFNTNALDFVKRSSKNNFKLNLDEDCRIARTILQYNNNNLIKSKINETLQESKNVFMVTSPGEGDGKTDISINLARSFAEVGFKTLVIDANGRNFMLSKMFNIENNIGLSDLLAKKVGNLTTKNNAIDSKINDNTFPTKIISFNKYINSILNDNLFLLGWGISNINPADSFIMGQVEIIIEQLRQNFDYIIIDTPSMTQYADSRVLLNCTDEVLVVVSQYKTNINAVMESKKVFDIMNIKNINLFWIAEPS
ncbi:AAA family ATPase [Clostridium sp. CX1]|uniref:polysaccharide biosynthesis tyrosine autokinase n=1 Tax=Clostridium sp. CX1 TaxID=2978346 RepID=UPI0021C0DC11|nr:polysaccharide biosynthesis tyrosine autokinase [Clostridium sp. CX1]MCT8975964.1 AAA family ATPase [Clostridium sp. CX1]